ncbi:MAG: hypothetical protein MI922_00705, partial [Bacteroidales bacterium]|nr:hypothetical protein [Bacteroidales bacterium]
VNFEFVYPNPLNKNKYVHVIGSNNMDCITLLLKRPWSQGRFDFVVQEGCNTQQLKGGYFNDNWNN